MTHADRLKKNPAVFRRLTGITPDIFDDVLQQLAPRYEEWHRTHLHHPDREREYGGGRPFKLPVEDRLLMLLIYYRTYVPHVFLGFLFVVNDSSVGRDINPLQPLLQGIFRIPERSILSKEEIMDLFFDGMEQPVERPQNKKKQKEHYSGKKKRHTIKHQVVASKTTKGKRTTVKIEALSKAFPGRMHDKKMYDRTRAVMPPGTRGKGDTGYLGTVLEIPVKNSKKRKITVEEKAFNRRHASERVAVEHAIGKLKIWRIAAEKFRNDLHGHTLILKNIVGLHNLMFS
jgi:hypothetical protein